MDTREKLRRYGCLHYGPIADNEIFTRAKGIIVENDEGRRFIDGVAGYSSGNLGHNHPRINGKMIAMLTPDKEGFALVGTVPNAYGTREQANFLEKICVMTGYEKALPMNSGAEAVETAIKLARSWAYNVKGVERGRAKILACEGNFHGRTTTIVGFSSEPLYREDFSPAMRGISRIPFGDVSVLEAKFKHYRKDMAAFLVEPIQGEGGVNIPDPGYLAECKRLCEKYDVLLIADEIQTGLGRAGEILASRLCGVKPDIALLGKSLGAGKVAVSVVLGDMKIMTLLKEGQHGSTYAGNAFSMGVACEALDVIFEEKLCENSRIKGACLLDLLRMKLADQKEFIKAIRGQALMIGIELREGILPKPVIRALLKNGIIAKNARNVIRVTPPLTISDKECEELARRVQAAFGDVFPVKEQEANVCAMK